MYNLLTALAAIGLGITILVLLIFADWCAHSPVVRRWLFKKRRDAIRNYESNTPINDAMDNLNLAALEVGIAMKNSIISSGPNKPKSGFAAMSREQHRAASARGGAKSKGKTRGKTNG